MRHLCQFIIRKKKTAGESVKEQKTAKTNTQHVKSPTTPMVLMASQDVPLERSDPWVFSDLGSFDVSDGNNHNGYSSSIISSILLPPVPSQAQKSGSLPSFGAWGHANKTAHQDITRLDGDNWLKAHEMSLLECGFQIVGSHKPEERFSRDEIIDELISTFHSGSEGSRGNSGSLGSGGSLFHQTGFRWQMALKG
jgi:hypothetical protein